jgi:ribosome biogenesis ATPase
LYVSLPLPEDRLSILIALSRKVNLAGDVDLKSIAYDPRAEGYSGADCAALLREAGLAVLRDLPRNISTENHLRPVIAQDISPEGSLGSTLQITQKHFDYAFAHVLPSVGKKDKANYEKIKERMARARARDSETVD